MGWATLEDVTTVTTRTVTADDLTMAQGSLELIVDKYSPDDDATISARDLKRLKRAVCWQAAWLASNPGMEARNLLTSLLQDGVQAQLATLDAAILAPLAKLAVRKLSFRRRNTIRLESDFERSFGAFPADFADDVDSDDDDFAWTPFGSQRRGGC